jgi:hypothetical protein
MDKEQQKTIRKFELWQQRKFASNAKRGWRFFQPDSVPKPTPRSSYEAWGETYKKDDDRRQERYVDWLLFAIIIFYVAFLIWKELP